MLLAIVACGGGLMWPGDARAQLVCTNSGSDQTCTNSGSIGVNSIVEAFIGGSGNATFTNSGSIGSGSIVAADVVLFGNAIFTNFGSIGSSVGFPLASTAP